MRAPSTVYYPASLPDSHASAVQASAGQRTGARFHLLDRDSTPHEVMYSMWSARIPNIRELTTRTRISRWAGDEDKSYMIFIDLRRRVEP